MAKLGPVVYNIWVNGVALWHPQILDAQLVECWGHHDMFYLRMEFLANTNLTQYSVWANGSPIQIEWGRRPLTQMWYGYVDSHQSASEADTGTSNSQVTYTCIGTSLVLNPGVSRTWEQASPTWIARKVAQENNFRAVTTPIVFPLDYEVQTGESNFQFLNRIANKCGMRFWCSGGTLYMISPTAALQGAGQSTPPTFTVNKLLGELDTCRNFQVTEGLNLPGSVQANRVIYGIDHGTGARFSASASPVTNTPNIAVKTTTSVTSQADAQNRVNAWAALSQFYIGATCTLYGNSNIYPGKLVNISGQALPASSGGTWLVASATHNMSASEQQAAQLDTYLTDVVLLRNQTKQRSTILSNITPVNPEFVTMSLNQNGNWVSQNLAAITVAVQ
jgi:phage protein D